MGNCVAKTNAREDNHLGILDGHRRDIYAAKQKPRRNSLGRLADFLSQQSTVLQDKVSAKLSTAAERGSREVVDVVQGPGYLDPVVWCAGLDVPVVK